MPTATKIRPVAVVPPPAPVRAEAVTISANGPIVPQSKRQHHFDDLAVSLAAKYGWAGEPNAEILGFRVIDCQNFLRKTLHEIHVAAAGGSPCPDFSNVAAHFEHVDPKDDTKRVRSSRRSSRRMPLRTWRRANGSAWLRRSTAPRADRASRSRRSRRTACRNSPHRNTTSRRPRNRRDTSRPRPGSVRARALPFPCPRIYHK